MVPARISEKNDALKRAILKQVPALKIKYTAGRYDINVFNQTVNENLALVNLTLWETIRPNLVSIPVDTKIKVDYGVLAAKNAGSDINNFMAILRRLV
jgi:hypothetical protein